MSDPVLNAPSPQPGLERSLYWGQLMMTSLYGVEFFITVYSTHLILALPPNNRKGRHVYIVIGLTLLALVTIVVFTDAVFLEFMWIDHRDSPGGPLGYLQANSAIWWQVLGTAANQLCNFIGDGLLMYRCFVIWNNDPWVIIFPVLLYLGSLAMGVMTLVQSAAPGSNFFRGKTVNFGTPWAALSVSLNVLLTCLICYRIVGARTNARRYLNSDRQSLNVYTSLASVLIESSLPFSLLGIVFAITYSKNLDQGPAFLFIWAVFSALSPQIIIFRVATGKAWTREIASTTRNSTMIFGGTKTIESYQLQSTLILSDEDSKTASRSVGSVSVRKVTPV